MMWYGAGDEKIDPAILVTLMPKENESLEKS